MPITKIAIAAPAPPSTAGVAHTGKIIPVLARVTLLGVAVTGWFSTARRDSSYAALASDFNRQIRARETSFSSFSPSAECSPV